MARITVVGNAAIITSELKLEDIKLIEKHCAEALTLKDENGNEYFRVGTCDGTGSIGKYGVEFGAKNQEGYATLTFVHDYTEGDIKEQIADAIGSEVMNLSKVEVKAQENLPEVTQRINAIKESITIVQ